MFKPGVSNRSLVTERSSLQLQIEFGEPERREPGQVSRKSQQEH